MISQLGPYFIDEELAEGGMARVFRARLRGLGGFEKTLVLKQIKPELAKDPHFVALFVREANTLVLLSHPHIVPVYELFAVEGNYYFSMEYVQGATVQHMLRQRPLAPGLVAHIGVQVCEALHYAHTNFDVLHRDLTPRNIIIDKSGHARLLDFGIATVAGERDASRFGSPGYMSPEQAEGAPLSAASDLFSLGAVLREALSGQPTFDARSEATLEPPRPLLDPPPGARPLLDVIDPMLKRDPAARPESARSVAQALRGYLAEAHPAGMLEDMQTRVREAQEAPRTPRPASIPPPGSATRKLHTQPIAMNPVLTEIMRSSGGSPVPTPAALDSAGPATRPIPGRGDRGASAAGRSTRLLLKSWPALAALALLSAFWLSQTKRRPQQAPPEPAAAQAAPARPSPAAPEIPTGAPTKRPEAEATVQTAAPLPAIASSADEKAKAAAAARLSINALPWAEVRVDGQKRGNTPLRALTLPAGTHEVELLCPPLGVRESLRVALPQGGRAKLVVDLAKSPPVTFLDGATALR